MTIGIGPRKLIRGKKPIIEVAVMLSEAEYHQLRAMKALTANGSISEVMRALLGYQPRPIGLGTAKSGYVTVNERDYNRAPE